MSIDTNEFLELMCRFHAAEGAEWTEFYNKIVEHINAARATPLAPTPTAAEGRADEVGKAELWDAINEHVHASEDMMRDLPQHGANNRWVEAQKELKVVIDSIFAAPLPRQAAVQEAQAETALQALVDQAQELDMGYEGVSTLPSTPLPAAVASPPGSAGSGKQITRYSLEQGGQRGFMIADSGGLWCRYLEVAAIQQPVQAVPRVLFDGCAVYEEVRRKAGHMRTSPENVSDVLDAVVRLIRAAKAAPGEPGQ
jgi:hypothetical protein